MQVTGLLGAIIEIMLFGISAMLIRHSSNSLLNLGFLSYYWLCFTVLTGIWEACFVSNYTNTALYSSQILSNKQHVWSQKYGLDMLIPSRLARIFYAEYGAYADSEYMTRTDFWSRLIESTHAIFCGLFSLGGLLTLLLTGNRSTYAVFAAVAMGSQLMNSILYMGQYFIKTRDSNSPNYNTPSFPVGKWLLDRPFMYVNVFWTLMPSLIIYNMI